MFCITKLKLYQIRDIELLSNKKILFLKIQSYDVIPNENRLLTNLNMFVKFIPFNKRSKRSL